MVWRVMIDGGPERNQLYLDAIPYLEKAIGIDSTNFQAAKTLSNIYSLPKHHKQFLCAPNDYLDPSHNSAANFRSSCSWKRS